MYGATKTVTLDWISIITYNLYKRILVHREEAKVTWCHIARHPYVIKYIKYLYVVTITFFMPSTQAVHMILKKRYQKLSLIKPPCWIHIRDIAYRTRINKLTSMSIPDDISRKLYLLSHCTNAEHTFYEHTGQNIDLINILLKHIKQKEQ